MIRVGKKTPQSVQERTSAPATFRWTNEVSPCNVRVILCSPVFDGIVPNEPFSVAPLPQALDNADVTSYWSLIVKVPDPPLSSISTSKYQTSVSHASLDEYPSSKNESYIS